jgi:hypothetical protein
MLVTGDVPGDPISAAVAHVPDVGFSMLTAIVLSQQLPAPSRLVQLPITALNNCSELAAHVPGVLNHNTTAFLDSLDHTELSVVTEPHQHKPCAPPAPQMPAMP